VNTLSHLDITKGGNISRANSFKAFLPIFSCEKNLEGNPWSVLISMIMFSMLIGNHCVTLHSLYSRKQQMTWSPW